MRMQRCPHCGSENSAKRNTCYHCQQPLGGGGAESPRPAASRWEAIEPLGRPPAERPQAEGAASGRPAPQSASPGGGSGRSYMPTFRQPLRHIRSMGIFFREFHILTGSGIALSSACRELSRRAPANLRGLASEMQAAVERGEPIHTVMEQHRDLFYPWHIGVLRAAQAGGYLPEAFEQIAHAYEVEWETRSALLARLFFYGVFGLPLVLTAIPLILMLNQPIPRDGWTWDLETQVALHYARTVSLPIVIGLVALILVWQALSATAWFQGLLQRAVLRVPMVGRVARTAALDRYLATLGLLLRGGVPVARAAEDAAYAAGNVALTARLLAVVAEVRSGTPLVQALATTRAFDRDTVNMAATGEVSGSLPDMLARAAGYYREENETKRRMLLRAAGIVLGVLWICLAGGVFLMGVRVYFNYAFRVMDWMLQ